MNIIVSSNKTQFTEKGISNALLSAWSFIVNAENGLLAIFMSRQNVLMLIDKQSGELTLKLKNVCLTFGCDKEKEKDCYNSITKELNINNNIIQLSQELLVNTGFLTRKISEIQNIGHLN